MHIKIGDFSFREVDIEGSEHELMSQADHFLNLAKETGGHNQLVWAKIRNKYYTQGKISMEDIEDCNRTQRYVLNQMKLALKSVEGGEDLLKDVAD